MVLSFTCLSTSIPVHWSCNSLLGKGGNLNVSYFGRPHDRPRVASSFIRPISYFPSPAAAVWLRIELTYQDLPLRSLILSKLWNNAWLVSWIEGRAAIVLERYRNIKTIKLAIPPCLSQSASKRPKCFPTFLDTFLTFWRPPERVDDGELPPRNLCLRPSTRYNENSPCPFPPSFPEVHSGIQSKTLFWGLG